MSGLVIKWFPHALVAAFLSRVDEEVVMHPIFDVIDQQFRHSPRLHFCGSAPAESSDATGNISTSGLPGRGATVEDVDILQPGPTEDPPSASGEDVGAGIVDINGLVAEDSPVAKAALQVFHVGQWVASQLARRNVRQVGQWVAEHRPRDVLPHVGFPR